MAVDDDSGVLQIAGIGQIFVCEEFMSQAIYKVTTEKNVPLSALTMFPNSKSFPTSQCSMSNKVQMKVNKIKTPSWPAQSPKKNG